jgi:hypothetical protein
MSTGGIVWGADTRISMPVPTGDVIQVPMFGFGMSQYRLVHDITLAEAQEMATPTYAPPASPGGMVVVRGDADLDSPAAQPPGTA